MLPAGVRDWRRATVPCSLQASCALFLAQQPFSAGRFTYGRRTAAADFVRHGSAFFHCTTKVGLNRPQHRNDACGCNLRFVGKFRIRCGFLRSFGLSPARAIAVCSKESSEPFGFCRSFPARCLFLLAGCVFQLAPVLIHVKVGGCFAQHMQMSISLNVPQQTKRQPFGMT